MRSFFVTFCILIGFIICSFGQTNFKFRDASSGLSQNTVTGIQQDKHGFLWIATQYGLNKYDGYKHEHYQHLVGEENSLSKNLIQDIEYQENGDQLWIGTYGGGLSRYDIQTDSFHHYNVANGVLSNDFITDLYLSDANILWVGTQEGGLHAIDAKSYKKIKSVGSFYLDQLNSTFITSICGDHNLLIIGTADEGLFVIDLSKGIVVPKKTNTSIRCISRGKTNQFLIGSNQGLWELNYADGSSNLTDTNFPAVKNSVILSVLQDNNNNILIGTENNGLVVYDEKGEQFTYKQNPNKLNQISGNSIWELYEDHSNKIWVGFFRKGLNKIDPSEQKLNTIEKFVTEEGESVQLNLVGALCYSETDSLLWIGDEGSGLFSYNKTKNTFSSHPNIWNSNSGKIVTALDVDSEGNIWVGTWMDGIKAYNPATNKTKIFSTKAPLTNRVCSDFIHAIVEDKNKNMWVSCYGTGVNIISNDKVVKLFDRDQLISKTITTIQEGCNNNIYLGTEESGIQEIEINENFDIVNSELYLNHNVSNKGDYNINDIIIDDQCNLWVATTEGLAYIDKKNNRTFYYTTQDGLPSNMVSSIELDQEGKIWASSLGGIFSFDPRTKIINSYFKSEELSTNEFSRDCSTVTQDGDFFFGNTMGFNFYNPQNLTYNKTVPPVYITDIQVSDVAINEIFDQPYSNLLKATPKFKYSQNDFTFEFTALNFTHSDQNQFQFRLVGLEDKWQKITNQRTAVFRNLNPGNYTFQVIGSNNDEIWNKTPSQYSFTISPVWYNSFLAWILYVLAFFAFGYWWIQGVLSKERLNSDLAIDRIELKKLKEIDKLKSKLFANISHEFMTPLTMIISPIQGFISKNEKTLDRETASIILRNAKRLKKYISNILDLASLDAETTKLRVTKNNLSDFIKDITDDYDIFCSSKSLELKLDLPIHPIYLYYDTGKMEAIFSNLISNAIKYTTKNGKIIIRATENDDTVHLSIEDSGRGIAPENIGLVFDRYYREKNENLVQGTGLGLSITKQLVTLHKGEISVQSETGVGSKFILQFKKGSEHFDSQSLYLGHEANNTEISNSKRVVPIELPTSKTPLFENQNLPLILVVEDNSDIRQYLHIILSEKYNLILAKDGAEGLEIALQQLPDVVITDVMMPKMNGYELVEKLKSNVLTNHIAILMMTVKSSKDSMLKGYSHGADYYLTKPFIPEILLLRIKNILNLRSKQLQAFSSSNNQDQLTENSELTDQDVEFLNQINELILENINNSKFGVSDITSALGYSKSQLYRKLKAIVNLSINEYLRNYRLKKAAEYLRENKFNISQTTYEVGFNDLQYFRTCFKKLFGVTPSTYAARYKNKSIS